MRALLATAAALLALRRGGSLTAQPKTPILGFSTWNCFQGAINDTELRGVADAMAASGLVASGYTYLNIDDEWAEDQRNAAGEIVASRTKFPSGMPAFASYLKARGMRLGLCECTTPGYPSPFLLTRHVVARHGPQLPHVLRPDARLPRQRVHRRQDLRGDGRGVCQERRLQRDLCARGAGLRRHGEGPGRCARGEADPQRQGPRPGRDGRAQGVAVPPGRQGPARCGPNPRLQRLPADPTRLCPQTLGKM